jgi:PAS domain S-box-containing protein
MPEGSGDSSGRYRRLTEHRVASLENRLDGLLSRLHVGVYRLTSDGILVSANASFLLFFGIDPLSLNKTINFTDNYLDEASRVDFYRVLLGTGQALDYPVCQRHPDGTDRWISLSKTTIIESNGIRYIDGLAEDVTLRKKTEEELIAKAEELARSNAELEEFAYVASHDLQEPLRTISSYASLLVHRYAPLLDEKGRSFLGHLTDSSLHMQNLIRDILAFSKIGKQVTEVQVNCNDILDRVIFNSEEGIAASGATISRDPLPTVIGDPVLLGQIFQNLFSNALKFRHKERPLHVHIGVEQQGVFWLFSVIDNGIGIHAQHYDKIFSIFHQLHTHDEYAGTGIGLAICRKAIQQFGGSISVDSELGSGSAFRFLLPCTA